jgi:hypothetical protein
MNKKQLLRIKKAMSYEDTPEQKRVLRQIKKQYISLSDKEKSQFLTEVEEFFANQNKQ